MPFRRWPRTGSVDGSVGIREFAAAVVAELQIWSFRCRSRTGSVDFRRWLEWGSVKCAVVTGCCCQQEGYVLLAWERMRLKFCCVGRDCGPWQSELAQRASFCKQMAAALR